MSIITHYVRWIGHDAAGTLPAVDVVAGVVRPGAWRLPAWWSPLSPDEALVLVPSQWIGEWEGGHRLAPAYQYLWRVRASQLHPQFGSSIHESYRPGRLPESASGPRPTRRRRERSG
jgi:hypothetical protein